MSEPSSPPAHFQGRDAIGHVAEAQARGIIAMTESHAHEIPGHLSAASDAARDVALLFMLTWLLLLPLAMPWQVIWQSSSLLCGAWLVWRAGRSAMLGWARLERLHNILQEEKWEIEHNRKQEREELKVLYASKGFEGKLLEDVLDVLMADNDRLLRVMVEEELGLTLEKHEHPLEQALGAILGGSITLALCMLCAWITPSWGFFIASLLCITTSTVVAACYEHNKITPAIIWNLGIVSLPSACLYFLLPYLNLS